ncbi:LEAF RUST 10 DISEASE-RESISTANCE LOCUS RECEPTOR-LIKE PROTEIN KINASE-like 1.2 isoform X6 [Tasmannia lanceolata]|uniref:LEAF RUST 10 DISEASE-RESISTANCE LOCUS RECEPTOR-LIKE PROTEIN KINASE-like 1.2 isoform X6 n=1 Tax=Tasmannia lanceolata TaxID=3420 RepID=UPI00406487CC
MHQLLLQSSLLFLFFAPISFSQDECGPSQSPCGGITLNISYPFHFNSPESCIYPDFEITCNDNLPQIKIGSRAYVVKNIDYEKSILTIVDREFVSNPCPLPSNNITLNSSLLDYTSGNQSIIFYNCSSEIQITEEDFHLVPYFATTGNYAYFTTDEIYMKRPLELFSNCRASVVSATKEKVNYLRGYPERVGDVLQEGFNLTWESGLCGPCHGTCDPNTDQRPTCLCSSNQTHLFLPCRTGTHKSEETKGIIIGVSTGVLVVLICIISLFCWCCRKRLRSKSSTLLSQNKFSDPSSRHDLEKCNSNFFGTPVFTYKELEEATENFAESRELGDGGFGTVYYGKLRDGRSVAVKRLYENNYKRVEQFMNEVEILSRVRHHNLVSLYGCTSRHSRELLLVYEFVPNGTVADHLHGERAQSGPLTWPIRMSIAIETAGALAYLHAVEPQIIHRDVKTNNILLDNNFQVKVADFGLSRLFPTDVTHVSTAPQGTPGYVDPDYHHCYQLTDKSDVYSFGVVLVELISSKPAVDITRNRHEINLAKMAINKIHNHALHEFVDMGLGFETDYGVRRMITLVAELAFRCLQEDREVRPSMEEVLEVLRGIESDDFPAKKAEDIDVPSDDVGLLNGIPPASPDTVMDTWASRTTTPNTSG